MPNRNSTFRISISGRSAMIGVVPQGIPCGKITIMEPDDMDRAVGVAIGAPLAVIAGQERGARRG